MKFTQVLRIAVSNLKSNKMRTILTVAGISVGIGAIVFLVSLGYGLQDLSIKKIASIEAVNTLEVSDGKQEINKLNQAMAGKFNALPNVTKVSPLMMVGGKTDIGSSKTDMVANLVDDNFFALDGTKVASGSLYPAGVSDQSVVSSGLVKALGSDTATELGKEIFVDLNFVAAGNQAATVTKKFKVAGVITDDSSSYIYAPISLFSDKVLDTTIFNSIKVAVSGTDKIPDARKAIEDLGFSVTSVADTISQVNQIFRIVQIVLALFGVIALVVAAIGMFNTMTIALLERTRDIGIMKAIGVYNIDVAKIFLSESAMIAVMGGVMGTVLGELTGFLINLGINSLAKSVGGEAQTLFYTPWWLAAGIIGFSVVVGFSTGFYPSKRASNLNPLDALRYE
ncbi:MAG: ABC transporter permease [Candidatus Berkelbacteria bacterium]|nr:ABC transporter permease [Candidatus Berkelbacteria bacterium]